MKNCDFAFIIAIALSTMMPHGKFLTAHLNFIFGVHLSHRSSLHAILNRHFQAGEKTHPNEGLAEAKAFILY